jgi:hypothetical protein
MFIGQFRKERLHFQDGPERRKFYFSLFPWDVINHHMASQPKRPQLMSARL